MRRRRRRLVALCHHSLPRAGHAQQQRGIQWRELTVTVIDSACKPNSTANAYVSNATVIPPAARGYLTLWPNDEAQPTVSTLNAPNGLITSNMAVVPTTDGSVDAYANDKTQLILDISGYFAP